VTPRKGTPPARETAKQPSLTQHRSQVAEVLQERIQLGKALKNREIRSSDEIDQLRVEQRKWHEYNVEYLSRCFDVPSVAESYNRWRGYGASFVNPSLAQRIESFRDGIGGQIGQIESVLERLELIPEAAQTASESRSTEDSRVVFIVHGHDEAAKAQVALFLGKLNLVPIILHEQPNLGQTIIDKFESNAARAGYAVVLLTPDDVGRDISSAPDSLVPRARQNVILELGYFCGVLGRERVCVLYKSEVEIPSDYLGVTYVPLDDGGGWKLNMAREIKHSGIDVDLNLAI